MSFRPFNNRYKHVLLVAGTMLSAIGLVTVLAALALRPVNQKNGFIRKFVAGTAKLVTAIEKDPQIVEVADVRGNEIYLKARTPDKLIITDAELNNQREMKLNVPVNNRKLSSVFYPFVYDSGQVDILAGRLPAAITAHISLQAKAKRFPAGVFTRAVRISPHTYVFRGFDSTLNKLDQIFSKGNIRTGELVRENNISELNGDAGLSTDGLLHYDETTNSLVYVFFYRNQFITIDTNLNLIYKKYTIDTDSAYKMEVGASKSGGKETISNTAPRKMSNKRNCVYKGKLYNYSKVKGDNEKDEEFEKNAPVDVYDIATGEYEGSFYIPFSNKEKIQQFGIVNDRILVIYKTRMASFELPTVLTKRTNAGSPR